MSTPALFNILLVLMKFSSTNVPRAANKDTGNGSYNNDNKEPFIIIVRKTHFFSLFIYVIFALLSLK
jgi:uncharacterized membrane protein